MGLHLGAAAWVGLAAACMFGPTGCGEDEPDNQPVDAASDGPRDTRSDVSVGTDVSSDGALADQRETGTPDASVEAGADTGAPETGTPDGGTPDGASCVGPGDAARDGAIGIAIVQSLNCARCHQDEPPDAGIFLTGRLTTIVNDAGVFPKNLTPDPQTGIGCWTDDQIVTAILTGFDNQGRELCRMPKYGTRLDAGTAQEVVNFLRTLQAVHKEIPVIGTCPPVPDAGADGGGDGATPGDGGTTEGGTDGATPDGGAPDGGDSASPDAAGDAGPIDAGGGDAVSTDVETDAGG